MLQELLVGFENIPVRQNKGGKKNRASGGHLIQHRTNTWGKGISDDHWIFFFGDNMQNSLGRQQP